MCPCGEFISWRSTAGIDVPRAAGATWQLRAPMWAQKETLAKRGCPGVVLIWWELQCIPGHSHSVQLFLDSLQKLKRHCSLFHCIKTETAKISSAWTSFKKGLKKGHALKNIAYIWKQRLSPFGCKCCYQDNNIILWDHKSKEEPSQIPKYRGQSWKNWSQCWRNYKRSLMFTGKVIIFGWLEANKKHTFWKFPLYNHK